MGPDQLSNQQIEELEQRIAALTTRLAKARDAVQEWSNANTSLSRSAAEARAKNQGAGRGFFGALLGSKYRGVVRSAAAASNASIAQQVATKRSSLAEGKRGAQDVVRSIQAELSQAKQELKILISTSRRRSTRDVKKSMGQSLDLLHKLKQARDAGLLSDQEFEEKRRKLVSGL